MSTLYDDIEGLRERIRLDPATHLYVKKDTLKGMIGLIESLDAVPPREYDYTRNEYR